MEAGKIELSATRFNLSELVESTTRSLALGAQRKGLELSFQVDPRAPAELVGDSGRLRQVLTNLIGNAIKFTATGSVVAAVAVDDPADHLRLRFSVRDTGIGIPREKQQKIFQAFEQADSSTTRNYGGSGLGLTISSRLVKLMGGRLQVESEPEVGSTFHFSLRFTSAEPLGKLEPKVAHSSPNEGAADRTGLAMAADARSPESARNTSAKSNSLRILVAEDNLVNRRLTAALLEKMGHRVTLANNGVEAVQRAQETAFDLIFMDVQMPCMDGFEAARQIRARQPSSGGQAPIVALTAHAMSGDRERCLVSGMDDYVSKPVSKKSLEEAVFRTTRFGAAAAMAHPGR
jgi:hypothetical protein